MENKEEESVYETKPISFKIEKREDFVTVTNLETVGFDPVTLEPVKYILKSGVTEEQLKNFTDNSKKRGLYSKKDELVTESGFYNKLNNK